jgi:polyhydroxyalkanoate synthesis regulator phasin
MKTLKNISKVIVASLLVISFACKKETEKKIEKVTDAVVEKTKTTIETTKIIRDSTSKKATDNKEIIENEIKKISIQFNAGSTKKVIEGSVTGREIRDYLFNIKKGQQLKLRLVTSSGRTPYFNLMEPGEEYEALYNSSINGNQYEGVSKKSGIYTARVYLMRSAARRNEIGTYQFEVSME